MRLLPVLIALACVAPARADGPFAALDFDAAVAKSRADGKLLLVVVAVNWIDACTQMDASTWPDAAVGRWIGEHAVAIELDADTSREVVTNFWLEDFPTCILLRDGKELDRHTGYLAPDRFVAWGDAALAGKTEDAVVLGRAREVLASDDFEQRVNAAFDAVARGADELARQHLLWLWQHSNHDVDYAELRSTFLPVAMAQLARRDEAARKDFFALLDQADAELQAWPGVPEPALWREWVALCHQFGQDGRIVTWYERHRDGNGRLFAAATASDVLPGIVDQVFGVLLSVGRPVDAVRLRSDLQPVLQRRMDEYRQALRPGVSLLSAEEQVHWRAAQQRSLRDDVAMVHAGLLGAGREEEAAAWAAALFGVLDDADSRIALVGAALEHSSARPEQLGAWLDEAAARGADVTGLQAKLAATAGAAK